MVRGLLRLIRLPAKPLHLRKSLCAREIQDNFDGGTATVPWAPLNGSPKLTCNQGTHNLQTQAFRILPVRQPNAVIGNCHCQELVISVSRCTVSQQPNSARPSLQTVLNSVRDQFVDDQGQGRGEIAGQFAEHPGPFGAYLLGR